MNLLSKLTKSPEKVFLTLLITSFTIFLSHYAIVGNGIWGDGRYYYAFIRSWVIDHDIDFSNERLVDPFYFDNIPTPIGRVGNKYSIGTPITWLPGYLSAHLISLVGNFLGFPLNPDGYGHLYRLFIGIDSVAYMILGLYLSYLVAARLTRPSMALFATLTLALGSHLFYYLAVDPANSHPPSVFVSGLILFVFFRFTRIPTSSGNRSQLTYPIALGLLTGLLGMIRNHDLIFTLPIIIWVILQPTTLFSRARSHCLYLFSLFIGFLPYLITLKRLYGTYTSPYFLTGSSFDLTHLQLLPVLFSSNNGLLLYSPILILSIWGLILLTRQKKSFFGLAGLLLICLQTLTLASWSGWWGGESFGGRMFLSLTPYFVLGLSYLFSQLPPRYIQMISLVSILLNLSLITRFLLSR